MSNSSVSEQPNGPNCIQIPRGWSRILEKGSILYISPNNSRLRSLDHVIEYLKTEGTCKCGLDCPLYIHKVFNFDARIPSKLVPVGSRPEGPQSSCKHCATDLFEVPTVPTEVTVQQPKKDAKLPSFSTLAKDALGQKRGPGRPRNSSSKSRRGNVPKPALNRPTSPLHNIPLPVPSSITNSPVQSVPTNITAVNQGPLPSFATIVSSSKLFNPGAGLGSAMLASSTVTSTVSSCPLTTVALLSSKSNSTTQNVCVSSSASILHTAPSLVHSTEASKVAPTVTSSVTVSHQQPVTVSAQLPSKTKEATLPKCSTAADSNPASLSATSSSLCSSDVSTVSKAISSAVTTVVSARAKTDPVSNQNLKSLSAENNSLEVKSVAKAGVPRASKPAKPYGGRKTVAASLKTTSVSKVSAASVTTRPIITDTSLPKMHTVATTATAPSCQVATGNRSSQLPSQVLPTVPVSTTVQAPALFHNVLKDPIGKEQGQLTHYIPSTQAQKTVTTPVVTSHSARLSHAAHSVRSKSVAQEKASAPAALTQGAFTQGVPTSHAVPRPPMHVTAQRPQPPAVGYSVVNSGTNFYGQVPLASGVSQQQNVQATTLPQGHTQVPSSAASVYGHVQNTAGSSQIPSLQIAASQTQGGVYIQGGGNQVFQMNIADTNQLKGAFQLQSALYQGAIPTTFLAANSAGKPAVPNAPGGVAQAVYPTNPYMLGILMPTAMSQSVTTASVTSTVTTATSPSVTAVAAPVPSVASYSYNNQNAAIAAAFESFVPIAPAASPRFSQTLAHLASAYTPFMPRGVVQGNTPVQFAQRMVPMSNMPTQACGNGQMGAPVLNLTDYTLKYPINAVKPSTYPTQVSTAATGASVNTLQQAAVVTAMPYVAFGQINSPRFPFAAVNFATPGAGTNSSNTAPSTPALGSAITPATSSHYAAGGNVDSQAGNAVLGYVTMPFNTNTGGASHVASNPFTGSAFSAPSSNTNVSFSSQGGHTPGPQHVTWCSPGAANQRGCHTSENNSPGCCVSTASSASIPLPSSRSSCAEVSAPSGIVSTTASTNCYQPGQSPRYSGGPSPLNSPTTFPQSSIPLSACQGSAMSETPVSSKNSMEDMPSQSQTYNTSDCCKKRHSPSGLSSALSKRTYDDGSDSKKRTKYDESAYYEANPLLGLKRSCEAIEVAYGEAEREDGEEGVEDSERPAKNEEASPGSSGKPGEGYLNSNNYGDHNNCNEDNCDSGEIKTPNEEQSSSAYVEPISERRQSHSVYNGDVTANRDKDQLARVVVNQDSYPPVKTNPMLPIPVERPDCHGGPPVPNTRPHFDIGDIVWAQARGLPSWPGKVVDESEVGKGRPDDGKRWVMWFGDHTFSQVEVDRLKTLSDGLRTLDDKARKKKYRAKKARISLEQAISEALEALEMRERLRARQAARSKAKKRRVR